MPDPKTEELQLDQLRRSAASASRRRSRPDSHEAVTHERRADRAAYLKEKLDERARSEDEQ